MGLNPGLNASGSSNTGRVPLQRFQFNLVVRAEDGQLGPVDDDTAKTLSYAPLAGAFASSEPVTAEASVVATGRATARSAPEFIAPAAAGGLLGGTLAYTTGAIGEALSTAEPAADVQEDAKASPVTGMETIGERREDDTCAPAGKDGAWVVLNRGSAKPDAIAYQAQISRMPHLPKGVIEYQVTDRVTGRSVDFDGCAFWSPQHELLEAKKGYDSLYSAADDHGFVPKSSSQMRDQVTRQTGIAGERPVDWHFSNKSMADLLRPQLNAVAAPGSSFHVQHTPAAD